MSDSFDNLSPKQLAKILAVANKETAESNQKAAQSLKEYNDLLLKIKENNRVIAQHNKDIATSNEIISNAKEKEVELNIQLKSATGDKAKQIRKEIKEQKNIVKLHKHLNKELGLEVAQISLINEGLIKATKSSNLLVASFRTGSKAIKEVTKDALKLKGAWGDAMSWQKDIQKTEQSMGILSKQSRGFRINMQKTAGFTNILGVNAGDLAKMQGSYSEQIGRSIQLSQKGLEAMAELSSGAMLGSEGAAEMAANMDSFGISATGARDRVEEMLNLASSMGVNSVKVTKNLLTNMKLANKFHFKGGVKGMANLATEAAKLGIDMTSIASMADKVFRPEGAVEMASRLQTIGGEFAKLGDPFKLMHKARNDFEGFTMDVANATKEFVKFNAKTGEFDVSGHSLDRVKEIADITGMASEQLVEMGRQAKKLETIKMETSLDDENSAFVASVAEFDSITNTWKATINGTTKNIKELGDKDVKRFREEKMALKERAKQAKSFDESWNDLKNTFKTLLLPILTGLSEGLKKPIQDFMTWMKESGTFEALFDAGIAIGDTIGSMLKAVSPLITTIANFIKDNPISSIAIAIGGLGLFKYAQWVANGLALGAGFNKVALAGGVGGRGAGSSFAKSAKKNNYTRGADGRLMKMGKGARLAKYGKGLLKGGAAGLVGGVAGMGMDAWRGSLDDQDSGFGKGLGVASNAAGWAGTGAMIGSIIPGIGTLAGGIIGGVAGAGKGIYDEYFSGGGNVEQFNDVILRSGQAPIGIDKDDDILAAKRGGAIDKAIDKSNSGSNTVGGKMNITFSPITINGSLELTGAANGSIDLSDPIFMRDLSRVIQEQIRKAIGGGKMNPNPI